MVCDRKTRCPPAVIDSFQHYLGTTRAFNVLSLGICRCYKADEFFILFFFVIIPEIDKDDLITKLQAAVIELSQNKRDTHVGDQR